MLSDVVGNIVSFWFKFLFLMYCFSMSRVLVLSLKALALQCFALVMFTVPFFRSMSWILSQVSSMGRVPRSLLMERNRAILVRACAISLSSCSVVGIFGVLS